MTLIDSAALSVFLRTILSCISPRRGRNKPAQGNALGDGSHHHVLALKGAYKHSRARRIADCFALSGLPRHGEFRSQGVALGWYVSAPSGQENGENVNGRRRKSGNNGESQWRGVVPSGQSCTPLAAMGTWCPAQRAGIDRQTPRWMGSLPDLRVTTNAPARGAAGEVRAVAGVSSRGAARHGVVE